MKVPQCKLCGKAHWSYEEHAGMETGTPGYVREMAAGALGLSEGAKARDAEVPNIRAMGDDVQHMGRINVTVTKKGDETPVTKPSVTKLGGRPKKHKDAAARQRAYRERK